MRIKLLYLCLLLLFLFKNTYAQNTITGVVTDSLNKPLINATIAIKANNVISKYTKTAANGAFTLTADTALLIDAIIEAKLFGYKATTITYNKTQSTYNFILKEAIINLAAVNVKHKPVITVKGDTLNYRTADFANENDRSIGDVLKKMPGIVVSESGKITYNNTPISKLYIDGDNLLDDKYNIGTKSIPNKAVTKVQVIDHDQPIKMLQKNNTSTDIAINLVIDKTAKLKVIGNAKLGAGLPKRYDENVDLILFKQNFKFLDNIAINNTGTDLSDDVISHNTASNLNLAANNRPNFLLNTGIGSTPFLPKSKYLINQTAIINTNNLFKFNAEKQLKTNIYYFYDKHNQNTAYFTEINLPTETININEQQANKPLNQSIYGQLNYIDNAAKHYINNGLTIDYTPNNNLATVNNLQNTFKQTLNQERFNLVNDLKYLQTLRSGTILNINSYVEQNSQTELLNITPGINEPIINAGNSYAQLTQQTVIPGFFTNNYITYSTLKNRITQSYQAGFSFQHINLGSTLQKTLNNNNQEILSNGENNINWNKFKLYVNPGLDYKTDALQISFRLPISLNLLNYTDAKATQSALINPSIGFNYQISQEKKLSLSYSFNETMGSLADVYSGTILKNYRSLQANNIPLQFTNTQSASAGYRYQKTISMFFASILANYSHTQLDNIIKSTINNNIQTNNVIPFANNITSFTLNGSIGKYLINLNTNIGFDVSMRNGGGKQLQNNVLFPYQNRSLTFGFNTNTRFTKNINWLFRSNYTLNNSLINKVKTSELVQLKQFSKIDATLFKKITLGLSANHIFIHQAQQRNLNYLFTDVNLKYKWLKIKTDFEFSINNLSNIKNFNTYFIDANSFTSATYTIPGRNALLKAIFAFN